MRKMAALASLISGHFNFPIVVILGSTGVGKSKLGIELAKKINGEVVSADSMQVYKGLDIITAKVTQAEQQECKHHLIDVVSPLEKFNVVDFRNMALPIISEISSRDKIPIVVGGTNYYIESLMWEILLEEFGVDDKNIYDSGFNKQTSDREVDSKKEQNSSGMLNSIFTSSEKTEVNSGVTGSKFAELSSKLDENYDYERLKMIDPIAASRVHPNDKRKVKRKLQITEKHGQSVTEFYKEQREKEGSDHLGGPLRFRNALVFWLHCDQDILKERLSNRVDEMLTNGLVAEISNFYSEYEKEVLNKNLSSKPYTEGIFQAIGFKEFRNFLRNTSDDSVACQKLLEDGIDALKRVTVKYSKKQTTWIRNRFLKRPKWSSPDVYQLDASSLDQWHETVLKPALKATEEFLKGEPISLQPLPKISKDPNQNAHRQHICKVCKDKLIVGDATWKAHCNARKHKKLASKKRKLEKEVLTMEP